MGGDIIIIKSVKYAGFISYSHADEAITARLHRVLETYPLPKSLRSKAGQTYGREKLSPIFRDTTELTAHHSLTEKIREAVQTSRFLIVICTPAAKASHWVNEEIRLFRSLHGEEAILCVLAEGTPGTSFPPALIEGGREPLAANISGGKENFKRGTTQLAASMLGVGLDVLVQRESKRRRRRLQLITASALVFSGVMAMTSLNAINARNEAQESRSQAEGLVEFMITGLKDELEPVGRLDILDKVGEEAVKYYEAQNIDDLSDESLIRQAAALHILVQVAIDSGNNEKAEHDAALAAKLTTEIFKRKPNDSEAIFAHAQSEYWLGEVKVQNNDHQGVLHHMEQYAVLGQKLYAIDPSSYKWTMERAWGSNNLAHAHFNLRKFDIAQRYYFEAIEYFEEALEIFPNNLTLKKELANVFVGVSNIAKEEGNNKTRKTYRQKEVLLLAELIKSQPQDMNLKYNYHHSSFRLYELEAQLNPSSCDINRSSGLLDEFQIFLNHDEMNYEWQREFAYTWYNLLKACPNIYSKNNYENQVDELLSYVDKAFKIEDQAEMRAYIKLLRQ